MAYEDMPIAQALNFYLYDAFVEGGESDVREWLGPDGKSFQELAPGSFTHERTAEVRGYVETGGLEDLEQWLSADGRNLALRLTLRPHYELVVLPLPGEGQPFIETEFFQRDYAQYHRSA